MRYYKSNNSEFSSTEGRKLDSEWIESLRGSLGEIEQQEAFVDLSAYLYVTAFNYLFATRPHIRKLAQYSHEDLQTVAEDFVQTFAYRLTRDDFHLLDKYIVGQGRFLSWAGQVMRNMIRSELRRRAWHADSQLEENLLNSEQQPNNHTSRPEVVFQINQLAEVIEKTLSKFSSKNRAIFQRYIIDGERAIDVAKDLGISTSGVYTSAHRIRQQISSKLIESGYAY